VAFQLSEAHVADYMLRGYVVFHGIIPSSLIRDLRQVALKGRDLARSKHGAQAQRIQPVGAFDLDPRPLRDYAELPELLEALRAVVGPDAWHGEPSMLGILLEPAAAPWCTAWHRDIADPSPEFKVYIDSIRNDIAYANQVNCALYDDSSTWFVPGSHCRDDVASEVEHAPKCPTNWQGMPEGDFDAADLEARCLDYCRDMPRAICLHLNAGDFALYRPLGWHLGNYVPYRIRATLHDAVWTKAARAAYEARLNSDAASTK